MEGHKRPSRLFSGNLPAMFWISIVLDAKSFYLDLKAAVYYNTRNIEILWTAWSEKNELFDLVLCVILVILQKRPYFPVERGSGRNSPRKIVPDKTDPIYKISH